MVHNAGPQAELAAQGGIGQIHPPTLDYALQDCSIQAVQLWVGSPRLSTMPEAHRAEFDRRQQLQLGPVRNTGCQALSQRQIRL